MHTVLPVLSNCIKIQSLKEVAVIRIVCPFCHSPLNAADLETATLGERVCLVCPDCEQVLLMDEAESSTQDEDATAYV